jgi:hypothetical protein
MVIQWSLNSKKIVTQLNDARRLTNTVRKSRKSGANDAKRMTARSAKWPPNDSRRLNDGRRPNDNRMTAEGQMTPKVNDARSANDTK